jgi:hypothetical protein
MSQLVRTTQLADTAEPLFGRFSTLFDRGRRRIRPCVESPIPSGRRHATIDDEVGAIHIDAIALMMAIGLMVAMGRAEDQDTKGVERLIDGSISCLIRPPPNSRCRSLSQSLP